MREQRFKKFSFFLLPIMVLAIVGWGLPEVWAQRADANVLAANAAIAYDDKHYDEALGLLNQALALDPQHERSLFYLGLVYLGKENPKKAIEPLETVHQLRPNDLNIQHHLGVAHFAAGNYDKANPFLETVFENNPDTENMGYYVGFLRYRDKEYGKAVEAFESNQTTSSATS